MKNVKVSLNGPQSLAGLVLMLMWLAGIALASGFWLTALACVFPPYGWYLVVARVLQLTGVTP